MGVVKLGNPVLAVKALLAAVPNRLVVETPLASIPVYCTPASRLLLIIVVASLLKLTANTIFIPGRKCLGGFVFSLYPALAHWELGGPLLLASQSGFPVTVWLVNLTTLVRITSQPVSGKITFPLESVAQPEPPIWVMGLFPLKLS